MVPTRPSKSAIEASKSLTFDVIAACVAPSTPVFPEKLAHAVFREAS